MKYRKTAAALCVMLLSLCGCTRVGQGRESKQEAPEVMLQDDTIKVLTCTINHNKMIYNANGDQITTITQTIEVPKEELGLPEGVKMEDATEVITKSVTKKYEHMDGVNVHVKVDSEKAIVTLTINLPEADLDKLVEAGILDKGEMQNKYVSLKKTEETMKAHGCICELKEAN